MKANVARTFTPAGYAAAKAAEEVIGLEGGAFHSYKFRRTVRNRCAKAPRLPTLRVPSLGAALSKPRG
jgi:hypothetical protein